MTFAQEIIEIAGGEKVIAIVIGDKGWFDDETPNRGEVMTWKEAEPLLDYEYDGGYGSPDCHSIYAWTKTKVIFVVQYDGATNLTFVPRNPISGMPEMPGG